MKFFKKNIYHFTNISIKGLKQHILNILITNHSILVTKQVLKKLSQCSILLKNIRISELLMKEIVNHALLMIEYVKLTELIQL